MVAPRHRRTIIAIGVLLCVTGFDARAARGQSSAAAASSGSSPEFAALASRVSAQRAQDEHSYQEPLRVALDFLDHLILSGLNAAAAPPDLAAINRQLTALAPSDRPGGVYLLQQMTGSPPIYVLAANFGVSGPSAVRLYSRSAEHYQMAASIDSFSQPGFFDDFVEVLPIAAADGVFVTVSGRTDEAASGIFMAWRFTQQHLTQIWASELLTHSTYARRPEGLEISFCEHPDQDDPTLCPAITRRRFAWQSGKWVQLNLAALPGQR